MAIHSITSHWIIVLWMQSLFIHSDVTFLPFIFQLFVVLFTFSSMQSEHYILYFSSGLDTDAHQKPPEFVRIWEMYSAPFPCFHLRAAHFLSPGYTNCSISILHQAVTGSWGSSGDGWSLQAPFSNMHLTFVQTECENACVPSFFELLII